jgi:hypothetical protein
MPVDLHVEATPVPKGYRHWALRELPATLPTLAILAKMDGPDVELNEDDRPIPGLVTDGDGFEDSPDAEAIAGGIHHKGPSYLTIARQGHLLQWGFAGSPDEMTEAGRAIFLNALHYITRFARQPIIAFREAESRDGVATSLALLDVVGENQREGHLSRLFGASIPPGTGGDRAARLHWFDESRPYLAYAADAGTFGVDEEARALRIANDDPALLRRCIEDLEAGHDIVRAHRLLERYTDEMFETAPEWRAWLDANADRLAFSDIGGYKFRVAGARAHVPGARGPATSADVVTFMLDGWTHDNHTTVSVVVRVAPGFHVYAPNAEESGVTRLRFRMPADAKLKLERQPEMPSPPHGHLTGHYATVLHLDGSADEVGLLADFQACTEKYCLPPVTDHAMTTPLRRW